MYKTEKEGTSKYQNFLRWENLYMEEKPRDLVQ